jgi:alpha-beta hydrolase superfamily lysophospholipase
VTTGRVIPLARESFEIAGSGGHPIRGDVVHPRGEARGAVIVCHGFKGFARWGFFPYLSEQLAERGVRAIAFDFAGSGIGADRERFTELDAFRDNRFARELDDLAAVQRESESRGWLDERYGLFGHSRGGGVAVLHAAREPRVRALATWAAISTIARWGEEERARWRARGFAEVTNARTGEVLRVGTALLDEIEREADGALSITDAAARVGVPWLLAHGTADETVPFAEGERLAAAARPDVVTFAPIRGASHTMDARHPLPAPIPPRLERVVAMTAHHFRTHL